MSVTLNHTIVSTRDKVATASFLTVILGLPPHKLMKHFAVGEVGDTTLDFVEADADVASRHFAFLVSESEFDRTFDRLLKRGLSYWADPARNKSNEINHWDDGRGVYFDDPNGHLEEFLACDDANITAYVPNSKTSHNAAKGLFPRQDFRYIAADDEYDSPAGERLIYRFTSHEVGKNMRRHWSSACVCCPIKSQCATGVNRRMSRWEHEAIMEAAQTRLDNRPDAMRIRRRTVEHPFGTLKAWMGATHFLTKLLDGVSTEMSLHVLAYNFKRMIKIMGAKDLIDAIRA
ncbi:MAG: catechol 2,3-dioxygenase-like lactoylglutathione lyase family enzyme [Gammaproteobacteria bacterium]|jgi:catechol 2,3-dioxygenase-like lactoylglutathione lyase family enzyme